MQGVTTAEGDEWSEATSEFILLLRAATKLSRLEQVEVDRHSHRQIAGAVGVQLVARRRRWCFRARTRASGRRSPDRASPSKSTRRRTGPDVRMNSLSALRFASCSGKPCAALVLPERGGDGRADDRGCCGAFRADARRRPPSCRAAPSRAVALPFLLKSLMPSSQITARYAGERSTSRSSRCPADGPPANGFCGDVFGRARDLVAADAGVDHGDPVAVDRVQAARQHVRPAVVAVHRRGGAVGDRIAERHDRERVGRRQSCRPRRGSTRRRCCRETRLVLGRRPWPGAGRGDVGGRQRLGVPGHRPALAGDMEADRELAAGELSCRPARARRAARPRRSTPTCRARS